MILLNCGWMLFRGRRLLDLWLDVLKMEVSGMATAYKLSEKVFMSI